MARIGKKPIIISEKVEVKVEDSIVIVIGPKGELKLNIPIEVKCKFADNAVLINIEANKKDVDRLQGLYRSLIFNMVEGVCNGYKKDLELVGVGYRASNQGNKLELALGFSHNIVLNVAPEVKVETVSEKGKNPIVKLTSHDKQLVGQVAAKIRSFRAPEPYKGKGVKFVGEEVRRKAGKTA